MLIFGGWNNSLSVICRQEEHGAGRKAARSDIRVEPGRSYHFTITRQGGALDWAIDGRPFLAWTDPEPLAGAGHEYLAVNDWEADADVRQPRTSDPPPDRRHGRTSEVPRSISTARWPAWRAAGRCSSTRTTTPIPTRSRRRSASSGSLEHELGRDGRRSRYGGIVGRAQNRAMVENLKMPLTPVEQHRSRRQFDTIALVDSQPETGNNSLPHGHRIDIVDRSPPAARRAARAPPGATSGPTWAPPRRSSSTTCASARVPIDVPLATAFFFALRTETRDLGRESTEAERRAYLALVPLVDHNLLYRMTHPKVPRAHFAALDRALRSALVFGDVVAVNLGALGYPDLVAEIADLLLSYEGARFVLCMGQYDENPYLSLRTEADNARAGSVMRQVVGNDGAAGGHGTMAGARLFARVASEAELAVAFKDMVQRLLAALGHAITPGDPLLSLPPPIGGKDLERPGALSVDRRSRPRQRPTASGRGSR